MFSVYLQNTHFPRAQAQMSALAQQLAILDPRERLAQTLAELDATIERANKRSRFVQGERYTDPDGATAIKCIELASKLLADYHARTLSSVESIGTLDRAQAIAELEAVLAVWKDPAVSDEQWKASRQAAPPVEVKPRAGVVRRKKA